MASKEHCTGSNVQEVESCLHFLNMLNISFVLVGVKGVDGHAESGKNNELAKITMSIFCYVGCKFLDTGLAYIKGLIDMTAVVSVMTFEPCRSRGGFAAR
ncbi:hypothetical protein D3C76_1350060 [compost metagenome]